MEKFIRWHKLKIGSMQNLLRINNYETLWLSWFKGLIMGIILMSLLSGCYIYEGTTYTDPNYQNTGYYQPNTLTYYQNNYAPTIDLYYWNNLPYWGYYDGWYYYYGYRHSYPWWYYYQYSPSYYYSVQTHVYCYLGPKNYVVRPKSHRRHDNHKHRTYNVEHVNTTGSIVRNNSNAPIKYQNNSRTNNINTNTKPNRTNNTNIYNRSNEIYLNRNNNKTNINRSNRSNNKVNINRTNTNRNNSNRSNKSNTRRPR